MILQDQAVPEKAHGLNSPKVLLNLCKRVDGRNIIGIWIIAFRWKRINHTWHWVRMRAEGEILTQTVWRLKLAIACDWGELIGCTGCNYLLQLWNCAIIFYSAMVIHILRELSFVQCTNHHSQLLSWDIFISVTYCQSLCGMSFQCQCIIAM